MLNKQHIKNLTQYINDNHQTCMEVEVECNVTRQTFTVHVVGEDFENWQNGELAQKSFPYLSSSDRELLISGTSSEGFDMLFPS